MKVTHISVATTGGAGIAAFRLHQSLMKYTGIESNLIQQYNTAPENLEFNVSTVNKGNSLLDRVKARLDLTPEIHNQRSVADIPKNFEIITFPTTSYRLENNSLIEDCDIVHLHWVADFLNYPSFFKTIKKPIVWTLHDMNPFMGIFHYEGDRSRNIETLGKLDDVWMKKKEEYIHRNQNINLVAPSEWLLDKSKQSKAFSQYRHYPAIPHGLDLSKYPRLNRSDLKRKYGIDNGRKTVLFVAHDISVLRKGLDLLIDALNGLDNTNFNLISIGFGQMPIKENIYYQHFSNTRDISTLNELYSAADITIIPSREDVITNVMPESFANGTPVLSFSNGGMAEHISTGVNGILIDKIEAKSLMDGISAFIDEKFHFNIDTIREYAEKIFSDDIHSQKYEHLYNQVLNNSQ